MHFCNNPSCHNPVHCFLPPYVLDNLLNSDNPEIRNLAVSTIAAGAAARATRVTLATMPRMSAIPSPTSRKHRLIYDMERRDVPLPGKLVRSEGDSPIADEAVNEAYDYSGYTYDFYMDVLNRNSLDDNGMSLISSVHVTERGVNMSNAFWNGEQMAYGDGDGSLFLRFTKALDVVAHELTHGVVTHESNLEYLNESGALNEHFADVMGELVKQWHLKQTATEANWLMGDSIMGPGTRVKGIRSFKAEKAYENDPDFGTDPQPKHMRDKYTGSRDRGGVHINSGIPNHVFYLVATKLGGHAWEKAGKIWYATLKSLNSRSQFQDAAVQTHQNAGILFGSGSIEQQTVKEAWNTVGIII
jgi:Zn-dependent metalloprotease